jgi:hypothetical protein
VGRTPRRRRRPPDNTVDIYNKGWRVWERFCAAARLPELESSRGALMTFVT